MRLLLPLLLALTACSRVPRPPGPVAVVGRTPRDRPQVEDPEAPAPPPPARAPTALGRRVAAGARHYLEHDMTGFRNDCSGFVCAAFDHAGVELAGNGVSLWETARAAGGLHRRRRPQPGDLAFFDNTYDRDKNGRWDDLHTHVAVVLEVDPDGTIHLAHAGTAKGRTSLTMNLVHPTVHRDASGKLLNDYLRRKKDSDPPHYRYLSGELWAAFAAPETVLEPRSGS